MRQNESQEPSQGSRQEFSGLLPVAILGRAPSELDPIRHDFPMSRPIGDSLTMETIHGTSVADDPADHDGQEHTKHDSKLVVVFHAEVYHARLEKQMEKKRICSPPSR